MSDRRIERDSMGEVSVPVSALYGAQTQRAVDNFRLSELTLPAVFIDAVLRIKQAAARVWRDGQQKQVYLYRFMHVSTFIFLPQLCQI